MRCVDRAWHLRLLAGTVAVLAALAATTMGGEPAAVAGSPAAPDEKIARQVCLDSLEGLEREVAKFIALHPDALGHLDAGTLDEQRLSLHFPIKATVPQPPGETTGRGLVPSSPKENGLFFRYTLESGQTYHSLAFTRVGFSQHWNWSNKDFPGDIQEALGKVVTNSMRPVLELEDAAIAADLAGRGPGSYVLRGSPGPVLTASLAEGAGPDGLTLDLWETNSSDREVAVHPGHAQVIRDGKSLLRMVGEGGMPFETLMSNTKDPFLYLKPGEKVKLGSLPIGTRSPGTYRLRVAWSHDRAGWLDVTPTYRDGRPVWRKIDKAWVGVVVSNEVTVTVSDKAKR